MYDDSWANKEEADPKCPGMIGSLFAAALYKSQDADLMVFASRAGMLAPVPTNSVLSIASELRAANVGNSTDLTGAWRAINKPYDHIILLSDMQAWVGYTAPQQAHNDYCRRFGINPFVYSFDLAGYGSLQFAQSRVLCLAGFSDKVLEIMGRLTGDKDALVNAILATDIGRPSPDANRGSHSRGDCQSA